MPRRGENIFKRKDGRWEAPIFTITKMGKPNTALFTVTVIQKQRRKCLLNGLYNAVLIFMLQKG